MTRGFLGTSMTILKWIAAGAVLLVVLAAVGTQVWFAMSIRPVEPFVPTDKERAELAFYAQPESWFIAHLKGPRETVDGQTLDPKLQYMFEQTRPARASTMRTAPLIFATPWGRAFVRNGVDRQWLMFTKITTPMARLEDRTIAGRGGAIPVRIYWPRADGKLPILVYSHGGGWIFSSIAAEDRVTRLIANAAKVIVISVNYRLAPEHPYPAASDDSEDVFLWARAHAASLGGDAAKIGVGGDSAGGHAAINVAQRQIAAHRPGPAAMLLFYPGAGMPQHDRSYKLFGEGYGLDAAFIDFILPRAFPGHAPGSRDFDGFMSPVDAKSLKGMPPAVIATDGFDILRDVGRRFAERLKAEGVTVRYTNYPTLAHSFLQFSAVVKDADTASTQSAEQFGDLIRASAPAPAR
jgi:acetyl esterase/lipase